MEQLIKVWYPCEAAKLMNPGADRREMAEGGEMELVAERRGVRFEWGSVGQRSRPRGKSWGD